MGKLGINKYRLINPPIPPGIQSLGYNIGRMDFAGWSQPLEDFFKYQAPFVDKVTPLGVIDSATGDHISGEVKYSINVREGQVFIQDTYDITWIGAGTGPTQFIVGPGDQVKNLTYNGPVASIAATRQGAPAQFFTDSFNVRAQRADCMRFMEVHYTNSPEYDDLNPNVLVVEGANNRFYNKHCSWADCAFIAESYGKDLWVTTHHLMSDANITATAQAIDAAFTGTVYWEHSNEVWNGIFPQHQYALDAAAAHIPAYSGGPFLNAQAWHMDRTNEIGALVKAEIPGAVIVWGSHSATPFFATAVGVAQDGNANIDAWAIGPYAGGRWSRPQDPGVIQTLTDLEIADGARIDFTGNVQPEVLSWKAAADAEGVRLLAYEAGTHLDHADSAADSYLSASAQSAEMGVFYEEYLDWWHSNVGDLMCIFQDVGSPDDPWSHHHGERGAISPRWQSFLDRAN